MDDTRIHDRCTGIRTIDPHYGYREVYRLLGCDLSIEPTDLETDSSETGPSLGDIDLFVEGRA